MLWPGILFQSEDVLKFACIDFSSQHQTSKTTFYNDQPHYNINKKYNQEHLNNNQNLKHSEISEISVISEKIEKVAKLSEYVKVFDKSLKSTQLKQIK